MSPDTSLGPIPLGPADAPELHALHAPLFDPPWSAEALAGQLSQPGVAGLGLSDGGSLIGFILLQTVLDEAEILILAVIPSRQRGGVGRALLRAAIALVAAQGARALDLEVAVDNAPARALYARAGFEAAGRRPRYYRRRTGGPVDALRLRLPLPAAA